MDENDEPKPVYPPGFEQLEQPLVQLKNQLKAYDDVIKNLPPEKGNTLTLRPAGDPYRPPTREQKIAGYERQKETLKKNFKSYQETELATVRFEKAETIRQITRQQLGEEPGLPQKSILQEKDQPVKEQYMVNKAELLHFEKQPAVHPEADVPGQQSDIDEWSDRFLNLLQRGTNPGSGYDDKDPDKDDY